MIMDKLQKKVAWIISRYTLLLLMAFPNLYVFYLILTPLTIYPSYFLLKAFFNIDLIRNVLIINGSTAIELSKACIAGAAYYLLLILNLSIQKVSIAKRLKMVLCSFLILLLLNILRIFLLTIMFLSGNNYFDITHKLFWYSLSTIFVVGIWFWEVNTFKIKEIPFYSDLKFLYEKSLFVKK